MWPAVLLVKQQLSLVSHIQKKHNHVGKPFFMDTKAWAALINIFNNILQYLSLNSTHLGINALDECVANLSKLLEFVVVWKLAV
jgi:hypothetical protein